MNSNNRSRFDRTKVFELKAKTDGIIRTRQKLFNIFDDSRDLEHGYSLKEISATLRPKDVKSNGLPTYEGQDKTKSMIRSWRKQILKKSKLGMTDAVVIPFAVRDEKEGWLYYNMENKQEFKAVEKIGNDVIFGIEKLLMGFLKLLEKNKREKNEVNQAMREEIQRTLLALKKSRRNSH